MTPDDLLLEQLTQLRRTVEILEAELAVYKHRCLEVVRHNDELATELTALRTRPPRIAKGKAEPHN